MLSIRTLLLVASLVVASVVNLFFAPQLYEPRPPVFTGSDMVSIEKWSGQGYRLHPLWLADNLADATFTHVRMTESPHQTSEGREVGLLWNRQIVELSGLRIDESDYPLDLSRFSLQDDLKTFSQLTGSTRCDAVSGIQTTNRCEYFVAWDDNRPLGTKPIFIAVFTTIRSDSNEVGFVEKTLLERLLPVPLSHVPQIR
jgi:hypothetical protein